MLTGLFDYLRTLEHAESSDDAWSATVGFIRGLGVAQMGLSLELEGTDPLLMWTLPPWVVQQYLDEVYPGKDPTLPHCRTNFAPLFSGQAFIDRHPEFPIPYCKYLEDIVSEKARSAVAIPLHDPATGDWGKFSVSNGMTARRVRTFLSNAGVDGLRGFGGCIQPHPCARQGNLDRRCLPHGA